MSPGLESEQAVCASPTKHQDARRPRCAASRRAHQGTSTRPRPSCLGRVASEPSCSLPSRCRDARRPGRVEIFFRSDLNSIIASSNLSCSRSVRATSIAAKSVTRCSLPRIYVGHSFPGWANQPVGLIEITLDSCLNARLDPEPCRGFGVWVRR